MGFFFLMLSRMSSLDILDVNLLSDISFADIFSYSIGCLFFLLIFYFTVQKLFCVCAKAFWFDVVPLVYFAFFPLV